MKRAESRGFTLIEILVVLVITGFIVAILLQSLHQVIRLQTHFGSEIFHTQNGAMYADWFRQSIRGLMPDHVSGSRKFRGEPRRLSGLTISPMELESGSPAPFVWRLEFDSHTDLTALVYGDKGGKQTLTILTWRTDRGRFIYVDAENEAHDSWPPAPGKWPQLPKAIYLECGNGENMRLIVASPRASDLPLRRRKDFESL